MKDGLRHPETTYYVRVQLQTTDITVYLEFDLLR